jgi:hypothetical protein
VALIAFTKKSLIKRLSACTKSTTPAITRTQSARTRKWDNAGMLQKLVAVIRQLK